MKRIALHWQILIGLILGVGWSFFSAKWGLSELTSKWLMPFGTIFVNLLKLVAVPLVLFSILKGIGGLPNLHKMGRLGAKTVGTYVVTTLIAVTIGLGLVNMVQPGAQVSEDQRDRLVEMAAEISEEQGYENLLDEKKEDADAQRDAGPMQIIVDMVPDNIFSAMGNNRLMLQVIFFAIFFGICLSLIDRETAKPVHQLVSGLNEVILKMIALVMKAAPFFVFALMGGMLAKLAGDNPATIIEIFKVLGLYAILVVTGLGFLILIYPAVVATIAPNVGKGSWIKRYQYFLSGISPAQLLAFSTSSSAATLPVTMKCVRDRIGVSESTTNFVLPIGATVNMDGTSLFQAITVVFLAQLFGYDLTLVDQLTIVFTATLASIGAPAVPSAGTVMLIIVLESVGLPVWWITLILPIDRPLDMCRTVVNVTGDAMVASLVANSEGEFKKQTQENS